MQIHGASQLHGVQGLQGPHSNRNNAPRSSSSVGGTGDQVDISAAADAAAAAAEGGDVRTDLVARVRSEIADGTYETPDKLDTALSALLDDIA